MKNQSVVKSDASSGSHSCNDRRRPVAFWSLLVLLLVSVLVGYSANASDIPEWPHERESRLNVVESQILDVQRKLLTARVTKDTGKQKELEKQKKELEREQIQLLRANGQLR